VRVYRQRIRRENPAASDESLTWSEVIFSGTPTVLDTLRPREVRDALLT
jgi:hypothetical protein